jgi:hypothetical protein
MGVTVVQPRAGAARSLLRGLACTQR